MLLLELAKDYLVLTNGLSCLSVERNELIRLRTWILLKTKIALMVVVLY